MIGERKGDSQACRTACQPACLPESHRLASAGPLRGRCLAVQPLLGLERVHRGLGRHRRRIVGRHTPIHGLLLRGRHLLVLVLVLWLLHLHPVVRGILSGNGRRRLHHHLATAVARSKGIHGSRHYATIRGMHWHCLLLLLLRVAATSMHRITRLRGGEPVRWELLLLLRLSVAHWVSMHLLRTGIPHATDPTGASTSVVEG